MARQTLQETMDRLLLLIRAGYPVIFIETYEEARAMDFIVRAFRHLIRENRGKRLRRWCANTGVQELQLPITSCSVEDQIWLDIPGIEETQGWGDQDGVIHADRTFKELIDADPVTNPTVADSLTVFYDIYPQLEGLAADSLVRPLRAAAQELRQYYAAQRSGETRESYPYKTIIVIGPSSEQLATELKRDIRVIHFPLPEREELSQLLTKMVEAQQLDIPDPSDDDLESLGATKENYRERLIELVSAAGTGLTLTDYRLGINMFSVQGNRQLVAAHVEQMLYLKSQTIHSAALDYTPHVNVELGGLSTIREWIRIRRDAAVSESIRKEYALPAPKGIMLCGASGGGKSQLAKLVAKEFNLALLRLDVGALFGSYIGESEERTREALRLAEALAPVVLWIDEIDKAFAGISDGGDSGVSRRVLGYFLTWLSEKEESVFVVATANNFEDLLRHFPEFSRKGRFDQIFWVDIPTPEARQSIFGIYLKRALDRLQKNSGHEITIDNTITDQLAQNSTTRSVSLNDLTATEPLTRFCQLLAHPNISNAMTGAEIEYAIDDALYRAYDEISDGNYTLTQKTIYDVVTEAKALYRPQSPDDGILKKLRQIASNKGWPDA
ncbi:AAA family ATPase [Candidatus Sumerlaeota bacterium]|nr:AAA family ATPase [Candidatus Sumerlaeota bacterium]